MGVAGPTSTRTVFNPFIGFQTVLIALVGGATTLWGPLIAAIVFSLLAETLRLQLPQLYMMALGSLLILPRAGPPRRPCVAAPAALRACAEGALGERQPPRCWRQRPLCRCASAG